MMSSELNGYFDVFDCYNIGTGSRRVVVGHCWVKPPELFVLVDVLLEEIKK